jgi:hypothetical protein
MNRILAVAVLPVAAAIGSGACHQPGVDAPPAPDAAPFVEFYLGAVTGDTRAPGEHPPARSPLDEMLGGAE